MTSIKYRTIGGLKGTLAFAAVAFAALVVGPYAASTSESNAAQPVSLTQTEYFPDSYVNQATTVEPHVSTF